MEYQTVGIGRQFGYIYVGGSWSGNSLWDMQGNSGQVGFDHAAYGQGVYLVNDEKLLYLEYNPGSSSASPSSSIIYTFNQTNNQNRQDNQHHEIAISDEGSIFLTANSSIVNIDGGVTNYIDYPSGVDL